MLLASLDKNLDVKAVVDKDDVVWLDTADEPFEFYGLYDPKNITPYVRMPKEVAEKVSEGVKGLNGFTAGGRVRFATDSPYIAIKAEMPKTDFSVNMPYFAKAGFDLFTSRDGEMMFQAMFAPPPDMKEKGGYSTVKDTRTHGEMTDFTLNFPIYGGVKKLYIGVKEGSKLAKAAKYRNDKPIIYYGSSITQGGCASRAGMTYEALISQKYNLDYINMGFSGNCKAEIEMAEYLRTLDASIFVFDYDHNSPTLEHYEQTHKRFYDLYREKQPDTPFIIVTRPDYWWNDRECWARRIDVAYDTYSFARANGDKNIYFIDGQQLFDGDFRDNCTVEGCHPNDLGHYRMASHIGSVIIEILHHQKI